MVFLKDFFEKKIKKKKSTDDKKACKITKHAKHLNVYLMESVMGKRDKIFRIQTSLPKVVLILHYHNFTRIHTVK